MRSRFASEPLSILRRKTATLVLDQSSDFTAARFKGTVTTALRLELKHIKLPKSLLKALGSNG